MSETCIYCGDVDCSAEAALISGDWQRAALEFRKCRAKADDMHAATRAEVRAACGDHKALDPHLPPTWKRTPASSPWRARWVRSVAAGIVAVVHTDGRWAVLRDERDELCAGQAAGLLLAMQVADSAWTAIDAARHAVAALGGRHVGGLAAGGDR